MNKKFIFLIFLIFSTYLSFAQEEQGQEVAPVLEKSETSNEKKSTIKTLPKQTISKNTNKSEEKDIYLNFENTELSNFINYIAELKKINLIPHKSLKGVTVSLTIREPLTIDGAWNVFLTVLEMSGFSIIKIGNVDVVMPKNEKYKQPLPAFINVPIDTLPSSDINIRYVTFLENIDVSTIELLLKSMLDPADIVRPYTEVNGLIITGKSYNIKSAMKVIQALDQTGLQESVVVIKLKNINAKDAKDLFDSLKKEDAPSNLARILGRQAETTLQYFSPTTKIIAEERSNSLILLGNRNSIAKIEDFIVNNLDKELQETTSPLHIYELQHTDAEQIKTILETVTAVSAEMGVQTTKYGAVRGGVKYFKAMTFGVDKDGNRLIVSSSDKQDWTLLRKTIEDLDKPQPQVALECLFVSVDATNDKYLGGAVRNKKYGQIGKNINFQSPTATGVIVKGGTLPDTENLLGNMLAAMSGGLGSTLVTFGKSVGENINIWGIFKALQTQTNASILSKPFISVANKTTGHLEFGSSLRVVNETTSATEAAPFEGFTTVDALTTLDLTPQINVDGIIRLGIDIKISEFTETTNGNKDDKKIKTDVTVADGQVIALGGFIKSKTEETFKKTPILGDIPILGWLFKHKNRIETKNYIFIFISPTIIKPRKTPGTNLYTRMKLHQAKSKIDESSGLKNTKDPIHNWFFNPKGKKYSNKILDFANAKYQPTTVDIKNDPYYRVHTKRTNDIDDEEFNELQTQKNLEQEILQKKEPIVAVNKKFKKHKKTNLLAKTRIEKPESLHKKICLKETLNNNVDFKNLKINNPYKKTEHKNVNNSIRTLKKLKRRRQT